MEHQTYKQPGIISGAVTGLLLMLPVLGMTYLGSRLVGLPLIPLDFFDFLVPLIPGGVITIVIDIMVDTIIALGLGADVDTIAKGIEQAMGYAFVPIVGAALGALYFGIIQGRETQALPLGAALGVMLGAFFTVISLNSAFLSVPPLLATVWITVLFLLWGTALGWIYRDLSALPIVLNDQPEPAPQPEANVRQMGRREFLVRVGGATATLTLVGAGLGLALGGEEDVPAAEIALNDTTTPPEAPAEAAVEAGAEALPNANAAVQPAPGMRPEYTPVSEHYRIDIASRPIQIDLATWTLPFTGLLAAPQELTMDDLRSYERNDQYVTMQCISNRIGGNLISTTKWGGVPVRDVLNDLNLDPNAAWMRIEGADNFFEYVSVDMAMNDPNVTFVFEFDDQPLPERNGFPLRIYIPERYGMKQPKWITGIEFVSVDEGGYWVRRGWSQDAIMNTTSVVDTVATDHIYTDENGTLRVPIGGYAMSATRGISKVEVSINNGEWIEADLRDPISDRTWVFWRIDWAFEPGTHEFAVRAYEGDSTPQRELTQGVRPDGATGIHTAQATLPEFDAVSGDTGV